MGIGTGLADKEYQKGTILPESNLFWDLCKHSGQLRSRWDVGTCGKRSEIVSPALASRPTSFKGQLRGRHVSLVTGTQSSCRIVQAIMDAILVRA